MDQEINLVWNDYFCGELIKRYAKEVDCHSHNTTGISH